jgi:hypothetical protein
MLNKMAVLLENIFPIWKSTTLKNAYLKILIGCVRGNGGDRRDVSCLPIPFDY